MHPNGALRRALLLTPGPPREQLARVLRVDLQRADRLKRFLTFIVSEAIAGRQSASKVRDWCAGISQEESFDPRTDPSSACKRAVSVQSSYGITERRTHRSADDRLAKGGYAPVFRPREGRFWCGDPSAPCSSVTQQHRRAAPGGPQRRKISAISATRFAMKSSIALHSSQAYGSSHREPGDR
jgi:hypothetical protein